MISLTVPQEKKEVFKRRYQRATKGTGKLFVFAADQKMEHLNRDFSGEGVSTEAADPEHIFKIAEQGEVGVLATHLGMIARYGEQYRDIGYVVKVNGKTDLTSQDVVDPCSVSLCDIEDVFDFAENSGLNVVGVGYTIYLGSELEPEMLREASRVVLDAHRAGFLALLWIYPKGRSVQDATLADLVAGAAGVGLSLGADFVKVYPPKARLAQESAELLKQAVIAAGNTGVLCAGGVRAEKRALLETIYAQVNVAGASGCAVGRNIFQRSLKEAIGICRGINAILHEAATVDEAFAICG